MQGNQSHSHSRAFLLCPICQANVLDQELAADEELQCARCETVIKRGSRATSLQPAIALAITGFFLVILANTSPIMIFEVAESAQKNLIITGVIQLWDQGYWPISLLVFFSAIAAPFFYFTSVLYISLACSTRQRFPFAREVMNVVELLNSWNLVPVFAIACLAAVVKLKMLGNVHWRVGMLWIFLLSICSVMLAHAFDKELVEERLDQASGNRDE